MDSKANNNHKNDKGKQGTKDDMGSTYSRPKSVMTFDDKPRITKLQDVEYVQTQKIKEGMKLQVTLDAKIQDLDAILKDKRNLLASKHRITEGKEDVAMVMRNIKACHIRLENIRQKHNEAIAQNRQLRANIDSLRKEKEIFVAIFKQSEKDLDSKKDDVLGIIKNSNDEKKRLNRTSHQLIETKSMAFKERKEFDKEFRSIYKTFDIENRNEKLKEIKNRKENRDRDSSEEIKDKTGLKPSGGTKARTYITEPDSPSRMVRGKSMHQRDTRDPNSLLEEKRLEVEQFKQTFEKLKEETHTENMKEVVQTFLKFQDTNYSLFTYLNGLSEELELLRKQKKQMENDISEYRKGNNPDKTEDRTYYFHAREKSQDNGDEDTQKKNNGESSHKNSEMAEKEKQKLKEEKLKRINDEIKYYDSKTKILKEREEKLMKTINSLKVGIPIIFERIGCNTEEYTRELGEMFNMNEINEGNILQLLGIIEKRTNEILQMYHEVFPNKNSNEPKLARVQEDTNLNNNLVATTEALSYFEKLPPEEKDSAKILPREDFKKFSIEEYNKIIGKLKAKSKK